MPPEAPANPAVANAIMTPAPDAAVAIPQQQRRKIGELTQMRQSGEMPEMAHDPAARAPATDIAPRTADAPLFADEIETGDGELATVSEPADLAALESVDDSHDAEVMDPAEYERIRAMFDAPELAEPLLDKIVTATLPDGKPWPITVRSAIKGFLREEDYSRKNAALTQRENALEQSRQGLMNLLTQMDDPRTFPDVMRRMGKYGRLHERDAGGRCIPGTGAGYLGASDLLGDQLYVELMLKQKNPEAYARLLGERQAAQEAWQLREQNNQLQAQLAQSQARQVPPPDQEQARTIHQLEQLMPRALQVAGLAQLMAANEAFALEWKVNSDKLFSLHWQNLQTTLSPEQLESGPPMDFVQSVVNATVQSCQRRAAAIGRPVPNPNMPPPSQGLTGAPARQGQNGAAPKRAKIGDMSIERLRSAR